jgi:GxxExxY protein
MLQELTADGARQREGLAFCGGVTLACGVRMTSERTGAALLASDITRVVIRAFYKTYNELGPGFPEFVTRTALAIAVRDEGVAAREEAFLPVWFRGHRIVTFKADLVVAEKVIVEVKVGKEVQPFHKAQLKNYLKATDLEVGLLLHFGPEPRFYRLIYENAQKQRYFEPPFATGVDEPPGNNGGEPPV